MDLESRARLEQNPTWRIGNLHDLNNTFSLIEPDQNAQHASGIKMSMYLQASQL